MSPIRRWLLMFLALALSGGGHLLSAQQGRGGSGLGLYGVGPRLGENVALALEFQDQLGLTQDQVATLQLVQDGIRQDVVPVETEMDGLRAAILVGEVSSADGLPLLRGLFGEFQAVSAPYREEVDAILTPVQHQTLQGIMWETRPIQGSALGMSGVGWNPVLGTSRGAWLGRGAGYGLARGGGMALGRSAGVGMARGGGMALGRGAGVGMARGGGRGFGRARGLRWRY